MHHHYDDILSRIAEAPQWFDEHAVPRFGPFAPGLCADIYADEVVLLAIECQACRQSFNVAMSQNRATRIMREHRRREMRHSDAAPAPDIDMSLAGAVRTRAIHFGDPPNIGCCPAGPTMNSEPRRVLQFWRRSKDHFSWERDASLEIELSCPDGAADG